MDNQQYQQIITRLDVLDKKFDALIEALNNTKASTPKPKNNPNSIVKPKKHTALPSDGLPPPPTASDSPRVVANGRADYKMVYKDSGGNISERDINVRNVTAKNGKLYVSAYCFKRKRVKQFVASSIVSLYDIERDKNFVNIDEIYASLSEWMVA